MNMYSSRGPERSWVFPGSLGIRHGGEMADGGCPRRTWTRVVERLDAT